MNPRDGGTGGPDDATQGADSRDSSSSKRIRLDKPKDSYALARALGEVQERLTHYCEALARFVRGEERFAVFSALPHSPSDAEGELDQFVVDASWVLGCAAGRRDFEAPPDSKLREQLADAQGDAASREALRLARCAQDFESRQESIAADVEAIVHERDTLVAELEATKRHHDRMRVADAEQLCTLRRERDEAVERRTKLEKAHNALNDAMRNLAKGAGALEHWVSRDGYTQLPEPMRKELAADGAWVWFVRGKERWEAWPEAELEKLLAGMGRDLTPAAAPPAAPVWALWSVERRAFAVLYKDGNFAGANAAPALCSHESIAKTYVREVREKYGFALVPVALPTAPKPPEGT